jgi:hypothetical protein
MVNSIPAGSRILDEDLAPWRTQINSNMAPGWTSYTPTWTAATTNPVIGNGTITGQYRRSANSDIVHWWLRILIGSTTTFGSGVYRFGIGTVPALSAGAKLWASPQGWIRDSSTTANFATVGRWDSASNTFIASVAGSLVLQGTPITLATADEIVLNGWHEPA